MFAKIKKIKELKKEVLKTLEAGKNVQLYRRFRQRSNREREYCFISDDSYRLRRFGFRCARRLKVFGFYNSNKKKRGFPPWWVFWRSTRMEVV